MLSPDLGQEQKLLSAVRALNMHANDGCDASLFDIMCP